MTREAGQADFGAPDARAILSGSRAVFLSDFMGDPAAVEAALRPDVRALALVSPNNPTGAVAATGIAPDKLSEIAALMRTLSGHYDQAARAAASL